MDDVRVHRDSPEPAKLGALAFTKGSDIHLGPGQERHLPHEAWHVVQQKQGRVQATTQLKGVEINDSAALEAEADAMGSRAAAHRSDGGFPGAGRKGAGRPARVIQCIIDAATFAARTPATTWRPRRSVAFIDRKLNAYHAAPAAGKLEALEALIRTIRDYVEARRKAGDKDTARMAAAQALYHEAEDERPLAAQQTKLGALAATKGKARVIGGDAKLPKGVEESRLDL